MKIEVNEILLEKFEKFIDLSILALTKYLNEHKKVYKGNIIGVCGALYGDNIINVYLCKDKIEEGFYFEDEIFDYFNIRSSDELGRSRELDDILRNDNNQFNFLESIDIHDCKNRIYWEDNKLIDDYVEEVGEEGIPAICDIFLYDDYMNDIIIPKYKNMED